VAGGVSPGMIEAVQRHIYDALAQTSEHSTLPADQQDGVLAQACAEVCDLLGSWLNSPEWKGLRPAGRAPVADAIPEWERVKPFLGPLREALIHVAQRQKDMPAARDIGDPAAYIDAAIQAAGQTARRHRRYDRGELFETAATRLSELQTEVCKLAADLRSKTATAEQRAKWRKRARSVLAKIPGLLLTLSLAMAGAGPHDVQQHIPEWGHEAVKVLMVHQIAQSAQPSVRVAPPRLGPRLG
jgi:hypothetical protein